MAVSKITQGSMDNSAIHGRRNMIINGAMQIAQRGTSAVAAGAGTYPSVDRFKAWESTDGAYTVEQSTTAPAGFTTSLKAQVTTADTSLAAAQYAQLSQQIEAQNLQHLEYGTSGSKTLTLSFHVRSSKTGSYSITLYKNDSTEYLFSKSYTIDSANTWEKKTITIAPDSNIKASGGAIANDNGIGFYVFWNLAGGTNYDDATDNAWSSNTSHFHTNSQVNWMDSTSNNFYLTGVQLEIGSTASPYEHRSYIDTLNDCYRYCYRIQRTDAYGEFLTIRTYSTSAGTGVMMLPVSMRASPTFTSSTVNTSNFSYSITTIGSSGTDSSNRLNTHNAVGAFTANGAAVIQKANNTDMIFLQYDAEL